MYNKLTDRPIPDFLVVVLPTNRLLESNLTVLALITSIPGFIKNGRPSRPILNLSINSLVVVKLSATHKAVL